ncbi:MAG: ribonuclease P protein component [Candidatus Daviesbacteria bacterium]|nr:ribonuclease P protein component [Candidatus Daviesbacteria bacterium]
MLGKSQRLNLKKDFKWVTSGGKGIDTKFLKMFVRVGENETAKLGIALSGKSFKEAHERNRARRLASAAFEVLHSALPSNLNIVALPKASILGVKSGDVLIDLEERLKHEKIID